jgi:hypothetical protein
MRDTTEHQFEQICKSPAQIGTPPQAEAALWACMSIWAVENLPPGKNHVHTAVGVIRKTQRALDDMAGHSFHDLTTRKNDYTPVVTHMTSAFNLLKLQAEGNNVERQTKRFTKMMSEQNSPTCARMKQIFCAENCPFCWGKRPNVVDMAFNDKGCFCHGQLSPEHHA